MEIQNVDDVVNKIRDERLTDAQLQQESTLAAVKKPCSFLGQSSRIPRLNTRFFGQLSKMSKFLSVTYRSLKLVIRYSIYALDRLLSLYSMT